MRRHAGAHRDGLQYGGRKPAETSVIEFCSKCLNLSLEELKSVSVILFIHFKNCSDSQIPRNKSLYQHDSSLGRHVNPTSRKSLEIQA